MMTICITAIENCFAPMIVKRTLFTTPIASFLFGASFNTYLLHVQSHCYQAPPSAQSYNYRALYMSTIATTRDYTSKCLNVLLWIKFKHNFFANMHRSRPFLYAFCMQEGVWLLYIFFQNHNYQGGTGNFTYKALILTGQQKALVKYDSLIVQPHKCCVPPTLPSSQIAIYFAQITQPFIIAIASQLASYIVPLVTSLAIAIYFAQTTQPFFHYSYSYIVPRVCVHVSVPEASNNQWRDMNSI